MFRNSLSASAILLLTAFSAIGMGPLPTTSAAATQTIGRDGVRPSDALLGGPIGQQCTIVTTQDANGFIRRRRVCR